MYLMYVDESGDCGLPAGGSPTRYFILSGLVLHELRWKDTLAKLIDFRKRMKISFKVRLRDEIHASDMISRHGKELAFLTRNERLTILRHFINEIASLNEVSVINILVDKQTKTPGYDVFGMAWRALLQRFENTISHKNFPGPSNPDDRGIIFPDNTDNKKLRMLIRMLRHYNPIPSVYGPAIRSLPLVTIIEDPNFRNSRESYFVQAVDTVAFFLKQFVDPCHYMKKQGGHKYFTRLNPILCKCAAPSDLLGIVRL